jgi:hypothetical protein
MPHSRYCHCCPDPQHWPSPCPHPSRRPIPNPCPTGRLAATRAFQPPTCCVAGSCYPFPGMTRRMTHAGHIQYKSYASSTCRRVWRESNTGEDMLGIGDILPVHMVQLSHSLAQHVWMQGCMHIPLLVSPILPVLPPIHSSLTSCPLPSIF